MTDAAILAIDQGTTSSRAILFDTTGRQLSAAQQEFKQHFPNSGWVEHDPEEIWATTVAVCHQALAAQASLSPAAIGITNQRETTVVWERSSGRPIYPAIVWQDRRTATVCETLRESGVESLVQAKTGLLLDAYFSATKIAWILDNVDGARARAERGELAFGTIDCFLIWRLTEGASHATDATNASRTLLFDIHQQRFDDELLELFRIPRSLLPEVKDCADDFGVASVEPFAAGVPICGVAGDQQAATVGQACFSPGMIKSTYGTGCFAVMNTGERALSSRAGLLSTVAYRFDGKPTYALEGSIFIAGAAVQWIRDALKLIEQAGQTESLARSLDNNGGVYLVPGFVGLGAPHWNPHARGAIFGLTRDSGIAHFARAALESVCYQTYDLCRAMAVDLGGSELDSGDGGAISALRVDGGMVNNDWVLQFLSDLLQLPVERPQNIETTAVGAAILATRGAGLRAASEPMGEQWRLERRFEPQMSNDHAQVLLQGWHSAIAATQEFAANAARPA